MSQTKVNLGRVPKERGEYSATAKYYKDNIVEYGGSAYIASPTSSVNDGNDGTTDNPEYYLKNRVPFVTDPNTANAGWRIFANGRHVFSTGEDISSVGIDEEPTAGSTKLVESGGVQKELALGAVYDVSAKNPTLGRNNDGKFESLSALLSDNNLNTLIPTSVRKGGMSIKFVQSSDNKYVQYRLMLSTFTAAQFTNTANWQGVTSELKAGSKDLVESGGVVIGIEQGLAKIADEIKSKNLFDKSGIIGDKIVNTSGGLGNVGSYTYNKCTGLIPVEPNKYYCISGDTITAAPNIRCLAADGTTAMKVLAPSTGTAYAATYQMPNSDGTATLLTMNGQFKTPANAAYVQFNVATKNTDSIDTIMLELVGNTYNPNFVPSEYEPYSAPTLVIKNDAIDMDNAPVENSIKPVSSGGVYAAIEGVNENLSAFEEKKVAEFNETPSDENFPSEKLVYDEAVTPVRVIQDVIVVVQGKNLYDYQTVGKINGVIKTNGDITTQYNGFITGLIPVKPNHYYYISSDFFATSIVSRAIRCLASDGVTKMKVLAPSNGAEWTNYYIPNSDASDTAINGQIKTPANAAYLQVNLTPINVTTWDDKYLLMLEDVGDTYNPDFVPSAYEPYVEPHAVVKAEAIETDNEPVEDSIKPITSGGVYEALQEFTPPEKKKLSVLLIGSSHGVNTICMFPVLAYHAGIDITVGNLYSGSSTLGVLDIRNNRQIPYMADHDVAFGRFAVYENGAWSQKTSKTIGYALSNWQWDVIILQRGASENTVWNESISNFYQHLLDYIKEHSVIGGINYTPKIYFNSGITDAYGDSGRSTQINITNSIMTSAKAQKTEYGIDIIPTAVAVQYARATCLKDTGNYEKHDMAIDSQHLDAGIGQYVTGCTVFEKIVGDFFNMSVRELAYYPTDSDIMLGKRDPGDYFTPITDYYSRIAKQCAMIAVMDDEYITEHAAALTDKYGTLPSTFSITNSLTGCTNSNPATSIGSDEVYMTTLNVTSGSMQSVVVTMGGTDITSSVYSAHEGYYAIRIGVVTGNIVITASAS